MTCLVYDSRPTRLPLGFSAALVHEMGITVCLPQLRFLPAEAGWPSSLNLTACLCMYIGIPTTRLDIACQGGRFCLCLEVQYASCCIGMDYWGNQFGLHHSLDGETCGGCATDAVIIALSRAQGIVANGASCRAAKYEMRRDPGPHGVFAAGSPEAVVEQAHRARSYGKLRRASIVHMGGQDMIDFDRLSFDRVRMKDSPCLG